MFSRARERDPALKCGSSRGIRQRVCESACASSKRMKNLKRKIAQRNLNSLSRNSCYDFLKAKLNQKAA